MVKCPPTGIKSTSIFPIFSTISFSRSCPKSPQCKNDFSERINFVRRFSPLSAPWFSSCQTEKVWISTPETLNFPSSLIIVGFPFIMEMLL